MRSIRQIADPSKILAWGFVESGGLGPVPNGFEEVADPLPEAFELITLPPAREQLRTLYQSQPLSLRLAFGELFARVNAFWDNGDLEAVQATIEAATVSEDLQTLKAAMLEILENAPY